MKIPLNASTLSENEIVAVTEVMRSGFFTLGERCALFEKEFADYVGAKHAVFVNSGSSANLLALFALANPLVPGRRLMPGDEVIVPAVTWSTTIWPVIQAGAVPVFVDSSPETLQIEATQIEAAITPKTRAICAVHVLGNACDIVAIKGLAETHGLWLIEDTCEALGVKHRGRYVGTFGDIGTYSFFFSHHITTIEGGMAVTNDDDLADLMRCLRAHGWTRQMQGKAVWEAKYPDIDPRFLFINTGFNLRPTEINAAIGRIQLEKLAGFNEARAKIGREWAEALAPLADSGQLTPMRITPGAEEAWFGFPALCDTRARRDGLRAHLEAAEIETRPIICGNMVRQPALALYPHRAPASLPGADAIMDRGIYWGSHPLMTPQEIAYVTDTVRRFFT